MKKNEVIAIGGKFSNDYKEIVTLREDVKLKELDSIPRGFKTGYFLHPKSKKKFRAIKTLGSAGEIKPIDVLTVREMTDPYNFSIRRWFTDSAYGDPTLTDALNNRSNSFLSDGFTFELELASMLVTETDIFGQTKQRVLNPMEAQQMTLQYQQQYAGYVQLLFDWGKKQNIDLLFKMKRSHISTIVQGRSLTLILPKITELGPGELPVSLRVVTWQDTGQVIVDTLYWMILAVRTFFINKNICLPEEMVYITGKNWGLRRESDFYGASEFEAIIQLSRINKKVLNYDLSKAAEAGYITKLILSLATEGTQDQRRDQVQDIVNKILEQGSDVIGLEMGATVTPVPITVDSPMLEMIIKILDDRLISAAGSTKAQMGRTENLNRDTATIMEVENIRMVRTPDEMLIKTGFEQQLLNPLLAHLLGTTVDQMPVRIVIKRVTPTDEIVDNTLETKLAEIKLPSAATDTQAAGKTSGTPQLGQKDAQVPSLGSSAVTEYWTTPIPNSTVTPMQLFEKIIELPKSTLDKLLEKFITPKGSRIPAVSISPLEALEQKKLEKEIELLDTKKEMLKRT